MAGLRSLVRIPITYPFAFGVGFSGIKNGLADLLIQTQVEQCDNVDWRRVGVFSTFGLLFCGVWQGVLFTKIMPRLCPGAASFAAKSFREKLKDKNGLKQLGVQVFLENGINNPILYFPVFYGVKNGLENNQLNPFVNLKSGVDRCVLSAFCIRML